LQLYPNILEDDVAGRPFFVMAVAIMLLAALSFASDKKELKDAVAAVDANQKTPEGKNYEGTLNGDLQKYMPALRQCMKTENNKPADFDMFLRLTKEGKTDNVLIYPETAMAKCSQTALQNSQFSSPPQPEYWVNIHMQFKH
jgi:hypothetical protein